MIKKLKKIIFNDENILKTPELTGVYVFWSKRKPLYIGKSVNLKARIKSYKSLKLSLKTAKMISLADFFSYVVVSSEIEALLIEAKIVNTLQTPYNIQLKDDKHPLYIRITKDKFPMVLTARKINKSEPNLAFFGPFPSSVSVKKTLSLIRKVFPFSQHLPGRKVCIYSQMDLCKPCPSEIENENNMELKKKLISEYRTNIRLIGRFLDGNMNAVIKTLYKEMKVKVDLELFEDAAKIKSQIRAIEYITTPKYSVGAYLENPNFIEDVKRKETESLKKILSHFFKIKNIRRIECFDVAHLSGLFPVASMVTFIDAVPEKNYYRHFKIRQRNSRDDISNLSEVAKRRIKHLTDWGKPDLIVVDGGKGQVGVFIREFEKTGIPIIGIAKGRETLVIPEKTLPITYSLLNLRQDPALYLIQRLRNEAHRFSRKLHHKLLKDTLFQKDRPIVYTIKEG